MFSISGDLLGEVFKGASNFNQIVGTTLGGGIIMGGIGSVIAGGSFMDGFRNGAISAGLNHAFHALLEGGDEPTKKVGRPLTKNEITESRKVFSNKINYSEVRIINDKYLPFQGDDYAITPDNRIFYPKSTSDWTTDNSSLSLLIHEMTHVYQYQHGVNVLLIGGILQIFKFTTFGLYNPYDFNIIKTFSSYNIEQQGDYAKGIYFKGYPNTIP